MKYKIKIHPSGIEFDAEENISILDSALNVNVHLEHSCKNGDCGICAAELQIGCAVDADGNEYSSGRLLTCCTKPRSDLELNAVYFPELTHIRQKIIPAKVDQILFAAEDIAVIKLRLPPNAGFDYLPGQYIDITYQGITRSYSIANARTAPAQLELHIRCVPNGKFSELVTNEIKKETLLRIAGPKGTFFVRESQRPLIFLAGGTGFAPIKAMIEELLARQCKRELYLYWGMPAPEALYSDIGEKWAENNAHFSYVPVVSGHAENWQGRTGYVHHAVLEDFTDLADFEVYACGSPVMIEAAKQDFFRQGLKAGNFYSDAFTPAK